ncbi:hypothetical protein K502DRAFT_329758 [Neoconidiobolus thromboides FSU 785]|nr:hypothetical protein K502DRAFT_329758 [Neoconidiobolus thromboides FSU 785]
MVSELEDLISSQMEREGLISNETERSKYAQEFSNICDNFYNQGDVSSEKIISLIEFCNEEIINFSLVDITSGDMESIHQLLNKIGIFKGHWKYIEDRTLYLEIKRKRREEWHLSTNKRLNTELENQIQTLIKRDEDNNNNNLINKLDYFYLYLKKYQYQLGISSFLKGLLKFLKINLNHYEEKQFAWQLEDASLTQFGTSFMNDTCFLLVYQLNLIPIIKEYNDNTKLREWKFKNKINKLELKCLIKLMNMELNKDVTGPPSGNIIETKGEEYNKPLISKIGYYLTYPISILSQYFLIQLILLWIKIKNLNSSNI